MSGEEILGLYRRYCKEELEIAKPSISDILRVRDSHIKQDCLPNRAPDLILKGYEGNQSDFYFKEMMMYCHTNGNPYPLKYDNLGGILDFFDYDGDKIWLDLGEDITKAYQDYIFEKEFIEVIWPY